MSFRNWTHRVLALVAVLATLWLISRGRDELPGQKEKVVTQRLNPKVQVQLSRHRSKQNIELILRGEWQLLRPDGFEMEHGSDFEGQLVAEVDGARLGPYRPNIPHFVLSTKGDAAIRIAHRWYRGRLHVKYHKRESGGRREHLQLFLELPIEDYVAGVISGEMSTSSPRSGAALRAQAVAARTYALWKLQRGRDYLWDDPRDQNFESVDFETPSAYRAVEETAGQVLFWDGKILPAYYHADCGGHTSNSKKLLYTQKEVAPLRGVADPACRSAAGWERTTSADDLDSMARHYELGRWVERIQVDRNEPGRRCVTARIDGSGDTMRILNGDNLRSFLKIPSVRIQEMRSRSDGALVVRGQGRGHGVGLCQTGALTRSRDGQSYREILQHYYRGARIGSIAELESVQP